MFRPVSIVALVTLIAGCSGNMNGVLRGSGEHVSISRYAGLCLDSLQVTLPDGETFIGYITPAESDGKVDPFCVSPFQEKPSCESPSIPITRPLGRPTSN